MLVSLFGFLFLKNLSSDFLFQNLNYCDEISHIHIRNNISASFEKKISEKSSEQENCRSGKSIFSSVVYLEPDFKSDSFVDNPFSVVLFLKHNFQSPFIEVPRRPPRVYSSL